MVPVTEQFAAVNKSQLESVLKLAEIATENFEKLADVQVRAAKAALAESLKTFKQLASAKDVGEFGALSTSLTQPTWDKTSAYVKSVYDVVSASQAEFAQVLEAHVAEFNKNMVVALDGVLKNAPAGTDGLITPLKSAIHSANALYESMVKAAKQMAAVTEANISAATAPVAAAKKKAA
jgi:phasin family protein